MNDLEILNILIDNNNNSFIENVSFESLEIQ